MENNSTKIIIKGNVTGNNHRFGDTTNIFNSNTIYNNYYQYINSEQGISLTDTEKELVKIIFDNTQSEDERRQIVDSLHAIKNDSITEEAAQKDTLSSWAKLISYAKKLSNDVSVKVTSTFIAETIQHKWPHLKEFWTSLINT